MFLGLCTANLQRTVFFLYVFCTEDKAQSCSADLGVDFFSDRSPKNSFQFVFPFSSSFSSFASSSFPTPHIAKASPVKTPLFTSHETAQLRLATKCRTRQVTVFTRSFTSQLGHQAPPETRRQEQKELFVPEDTKLANASSISSHRNSMKPFFVLLQLRTKEAMQRMWKPQIFDEKSLEWR